ncbi:MAG TPA: hypothetical protein VFE62_02155 [Gemmataceae bacterium]|nr:hypothetical protein [Gemmataceae bacterium]
MAEAHPKLCLRPKAVGLNRPKLEHPVLGTLEYINVDGGWWQGVTIVAGCSARLDFQKGANPSQDDVEKAAKYLQTVRTHEPAFRAFVGQKLAERNFDTNVEEDVSGRPIPADLSKLRPSMVVLWSDWADLEYDCSALPEGHLLGANRVEVLLDAGETPTKLFLHRDDLRYKAGRLLQQIVPTQAEDYVNSLADQFISRVAQWGSIGFNPELRQLLTRAIEDVKRRLGGGTPDYLAYMRSVKALLLELEAATSSPESRIFDLRVYVRVRHPDGKRLPFKQKLVFAPGDRARFEGAGKFPIIYLFTVNDIEFEKDPDPLAAFTAAVPERYQQAACWLANQSPEVFESLRAAGFITDVFISIGARFATEYVDLPMPLEFLAQCSRLGFAITTSIGPWE